MLCNQNRECPLITSHKSRLLCSGFCHIALVKTDWKEILEGFHMRHDDTMMSQITPQTVKCVS